MEINKKIKVDVDKKIVEISNILNSPKKFMVIRFNPWLPTKFESIEAIKAYRHQFELEDSIKGRYTLVEIKNYNSENGDFLATAKDVEHKYYNTNDIVIVGKILLPKNSESIDTEFYKIYYPTEDNKISEGYSIIYKGGIKNIIQTQSLPEFEGIYKRPERNSNPSGLWKALFTNNAKNIPELLNTLKSEEPNLERLMDY